MLNSMQPFVQAHLNSMEKIIRGQFGIGADVGGEAYDAVNFTLKALAAITLPAMTNWALSHNEDWYKEAPDWQKDNGLLFRIGSTPSISRSRRCSAPSTVACSSAPPRPSSTTTRTPSTTWAPLWAWRCCRRASGSPRT